MSWVHRSKVAPGSAEISTCSWAFPWHEVHYCYAVKKCWLVFLQALIIRKHILGEFRTNRRMTMHKPRTQPCLVRLVRCCSIRIASVAWKASTELHQQIKWLKWSMVSIKNLHLFNLSMLPALCNSETTFRKDRCVFVAFPWILLYF